MAALNPYNIPVVATIAVMQALGAAAPQYPAVNVSNYQTGVVGGGGIFVWDPVSVATADHCNVFAATAVATGRYIRQSVPSDAGGVPLLNCSAKGDGTTDDSTAFGYAKAAVVATGKFGQILGEAGRTFKINSGQVLDIAKTGLDCRGAAIDASSLGSSTTFLQFDSTDANPYYPKVVLADCAITGPSGGSPGTTGTGVLFQGTLGGAVAHIKVVNTGIAGFHYGQRYFDSAYLIDNDHVSLFQDDIGVYAPAGCSNCGENISWSNGSSIFNNNTYGLDLRNPNGDYNLTQDSINHNQITGASTACQVNVVDAHASISNSHIEDYTHPVDCVSNNTSAPQLNLISNTYVRATAAATKLIDVQAGGYVYVSGGAVLALSSPQTLIGPSGGNMVVLGLQLGTAAFTTGTGNYTLCASLSNCLQGQNASFNGSLSVGSFMVCNPTPLALTVAGSWTVVGSSGAGVIEFHDVTDGGFATFAFDASGATLQSASDGITGFAARWSSGPQVRITSGTDPRSVNYCQRLLQ